ncbi:kininogen-1 [Macrotis lagotis]|uniref:kininogen-1 n=1 Tax=Macrotis lagotis TaxID=92651 RepID=UPI003D686597
MKLTVVLLLVVGQLTVQALGKDDLCEDSDAFRAVDLALTKYNNQRSFGPQFVLYRILSALLKGQTFQITYEIRESNCMIEEGKNWKECGYKDALEKAQGECTVTVDFQDGKEFNVTEQNCHITPVHDLVTEDRIPCFGCFTPISTNSSTVKSLLENALQFFNEKSKHEHLFTLKEVLHSLSQVVNGWNYDLRYSIVQTDCLKEDEHSNCNPMPQGEIMVCHDQIHMDMYMNITILSQACNPGNYSETQKMSVNSPELQEPLRQFLEKFNEENKSDFYYKIDNSLGAESMVGPGPGDHITFYIKETECSKEKDKFSEHCAFKKDGDVVTCSAKVSVTHAGTFNTTIDCNPLQMAFMRRPPGFSPFRSMRLNMDGMVALNEPQNSDMVEQEEEQAPGKRRGPPRGHGPWHQKGPNPGHWKKHHPGLGLGHNKHGHGHHERHNLRHEDRHGQGHWKHGEKDKKNHESWTNKYGDNPTGENSPSMTQEETQGPPPLNSPSPQGVTVSPFDFQDSDLFSSNPTNLPSAPPAEEEEEKTGEEEDFFIPDIPVQPKRPLFPLLPDFPEPSAPKCPGRPWKPIDVMNPIKEEIQVKPFLLSEALDSGKK